MLPGKIACHGGGAGLMSVNTTRAASAGPRTVSSHAGVGSSNRTMTTGTLPGT